MLDFAKCQAMSWVGLTSWLPKTLKPVRYTQSNIQEQFYQQYQEIVQPMLKFKEIKNSIIHHKPKTLTSQLEQSITPKARSPLTFKTITQHNEHSPIQKNSGQKGNFYKFDTNKKQNISPFREDTFKSDTKENNPKNIYYTKGNTTTFADLSFKKLQFTALPKRKLTFQEPNIYTEQIEDYTNSKSHLSFANLLHSKKPTSKGKFHLQSERKDDRQSSISKLKDKLFSMKRIISDKDKTPTNHNQNYNQNHNQCQTNREMTLSPYKSNTYEQDIVKISIKEDSPQDSPSHELDMTPYLF